MNTIKANNTYRQPLYCPRCKDALVAMSDKYFCQNCAHFYPILDGIPSLVDENTIVNMDSFDASAFEFLFEMERKHFWHVGRREIILDVIERDVPKLQNIRMLEIGCGNGSVLAFLKQNGIDIEGGDIFLEGLRFCRQRTSSVALYQIDALSLPFNNDYEVIGIFDVLEHIEDDEKVLAEINRALKAGGKLILTVPVHKFLWSRHDEASHHKRRYSRMELVTKLEQSGFAVEKVSYYMFFLFPLLAVIRLIGKYGKRRSAVKMGSTPLELKTVPVVNEVFLGLLRLERFLLRYFNLPFGTSLMFLARKT